MRKIRGFVGEIIYKTWNWHSFHLSLLKSNQICPYHTMSCSTSSSSRNLTPSDHPKPGIVFGSKPMVGDSHSHSPPNPQYPLALLVIEPKKHPHELNLIAKRANVRYPAKHICVSWSSSLFTLCVYIYIFIYLFIYLFFVYLLIYLYMCIRTYTCWPALPAWILFTPAI
jgi:hypothetical protein